MRGDGAREPALLSSPSRRSLSHWLRCPRRRGRAVGKAIHRRARPPVSARTRGDWRRRLLKQPGGRGGSGGLSRRGRGGARAGCGTHGPGRPVPSGVLSWQAWPPLCSPRTSAASYTSARFPARFRTHSNSSMLNADVTFFFFFFKCRPAAQDLGNEARRAAPPGYFPPSQRGLLVAR